MVIGLDFYGTITKNPKFFRQLTAALIAAGHLVYIISAVGEANVEKLKKDVRHSHVSHTALEIITFIDFEFVSGLKAEACKRLGVQCLIDDSDENCRDATKLGVMSFMVR